MTTTKQALLQIISENIREALREYKEANGVTQTQCQCCKQMLPNPYTQEWVGEQIGVSKATIVHYFQGNRIPSIVRLLQIASVLNVNLIDLLNGTNQQHNLQSNSET